MMLMEKRNDTTIMYHAIDTQCHKCFTIITRITMRYSTTLSKPFFIGSTIFSAFQRQNSKYLLLLRKKKARLRNVYVQSQIPSRDYQVRMSAKLLNFCRTDEMDSSGENPAKGNRAK